jgi:hypothetical protein
MDSAGGEKNWGKWQRCPLLNNEGAKAPSVDSAGGLKTLFEISEYFDASAHCMNISGKRAA